MGLLLVFTVLCFFLVQPLDAHVLLSKHQYAEHLMHRYLSRMRVEGRLSSSDEASLKAELASVGCVVDSDPTTWVQASAMESRGDPRVLRSPDASASTLMLSISCRPEPAPFRPTALVGGSPPSGVRIRVGGRELSERVYP